MIRRNEAAEGTSGESRTHHNTPHLDSCLSLFAFLCCSSVLCHNDIFFPFHDSALFRISHLLLCVLMESSETRVFVLTACYDIPCVSCLHAGVRLCAFMRASIRVGTEECSIVITCLQEARSTGHH
eukprot:c18700_g1_i1.p1 GENE.c18700_g1_i1~~c18700_g1_i1.p1  ORF type:complete len:126 (-),score=10.60 c18700_g1_i1:39-416(-)